MLKSYLKLALKVLLRRKFFTFISLFGISVTLLVLMVVAAIMDHTLAPSAPETRLDRTLFVPTAMLSGPHMRSSGAPGYGLLDKCARDLPGVENASFYTTRRSVISYVNGDRVVSEVRNADPAYWVILEFTFLEGGPLTAADEVAAEPVAVISESARRRFFGKGASAVGRFIDAGGQKLRVIGVVRSVSSMHEAAYADIWAPLSVAPGSNWRETLRANFNAMLLARDRAAFPAIQAEFRARVARLPMPHPEQYEKAASEAVTRFEAVARDITGAYELESPAAGRAILIMAVLGLAFMLLPAINLVNITVSRIFERASEIGVRKAFGASSVQLVGQFVVENVVLSLVGGALGLFGAAGVLAWLNGSGLIAEAAFQINGRVFLVALGLSVLFGLLSGVYPAWRMSRLNPVSALKGGGA